ncbi:MAG: serine/threonine-protein kinase [Solirubrobacterales bacterium]
MPDFSPESEFAGHRIDAEVKRGGMGVVYRATDLRLKRTVALKVIAPEYAREPEFRARFEREWSLAASIDHPNVIPVYHSGEEEGVLYTTMLWVEGVDLGDLIAREGRLSLPLAADIICQVAAGLDAAHARGLIHRDVKPANVLLRPDGQGGYHAYLSDFGLTKGVGGRTALTRTGMFVGTIDYIAPEQLLGSVVDARTDVYALGCVLFHALAGLPPYRGETEWATLKGHESGEIPPIRAVRPDLPAEIDEVIARALAKSPGDRYQSAGELGRAARAAAEPRSAPEVEPTGRQAETRLATAGATRVARADQAEKGAVPPRTRTRRLLALGLIPAVLLAGAAVFLLTQSNSTKKGSDLPSPADFPPGVIAVVTHVSPSIGKVTEADLEHANELASAECTATDTECKEAQDSSTTLGKLLEYVWLRGEATETGTAATPAEVSSQLARLKEEDFETEADYQAYVREHHYTEDDIFERVELQILAKKLQQHVEDAAQPSSGQTLQQARKAALKNFSAGYQRKWTLRTVCAANFAIKQCTSSGG